MGLTFIDWAIVAAYVVAAFLIGLAFAKKGAKGWYSLEDLYALDAA